LTFPRAYARVKKGKGRKIHVFEQSRERNPTHGIYDLTTMGMMIPMMMIITMTRDFRCLTAMKLLPLMSLPCACLPSDPPRHTRIYISPLPLGNRLLPRLRRPHGDAVGIVYVSASRRAR
jgi:hypothetical protein